MSIKKGLVAARACRLVVMPEWQGAGIGMRFLDLLCQRELDGEGWAKRPANTYFHTAHPALVAALRRSGSWEQRSQTVHGRGAGTLVMKNQGKENRTLQGHWRAVTGWKYTGKEGTHVQATG